MTHLPAVPPPDLRIIDINAVLPHESHDAQRASPLIERIRHAEYFTNPPIVADLQNGNYVLMDGANRHQTLKHLSFPHLLVQVADYKSDYVELGVWQHIVSDWQSSSLMNRLQIIQGIDIRDGWDSHAVAQILLREGPVYGVHAAIDHINERNATLRHVVESYHHHATLYRTPLTDPGHIWSLYPTGIALVMFPQYHPEDIIAAALNRAYLPPGVSRHIIHGRALKLNYPMRTLKADLPLEQKNKDLQQWIQQRLANRAVRYYAEATYQFDE